MRPYHLFARLFACLLCTSAVAVADEAELLQTIQSQQASDVDRANAFEKIGDIASADAVEPLSEFLADRRWSHYARIALQKMEGAKVTQALLQSLDTLQGDLKIGVIDTLGRRRDPTAIDSLSGLLDNQDEKVAAAAAAALGEIGTVEASDTLWQAFTSLKHAQRRESLASALLMVGQRLAKEGKTESALEIFDGLRNAEIPQAYRIGATRNAILTRGAGGAELMAEQLKSTAREQFEIGLAASRVLPGDQATRSLIDTLQAESSPDRQMLLILALKDRGDRQALDAILNKLEGGAAAVQMAAIDAIGRLGNASSVPILLSVANNENAEAILDSLVSLEGSGVNAELMKAAEPPTASTIAVRALGRRRVKEAVPLLFKISSSASPAASQEALVALGMVVSQDRFVDLFELLKSARSDERKMAIQRAIRAAVFRSTQPDACAEALGSMIPHSNGADREFLFEQIRTAGGNTAVALMRRFATGADEELQDAATKTLGRWLSADAAPVLLEVAQDGGKFANRALGGYIRIFRQFELPEAKRVAMAEQALNVATRPIERNAAIDAMTRFPCIGTFDLALTQLDVPGSEMAAAKAVLTIGRTVLDLDPQKGKAGLQQLIDANINQDVTDAAQQLLQTAPSQA